MTHALSALGFVPTRATARDSWRQLVAVASCFRGASVNAGSYLYWRISCRERHCRLAGACAPSDRENAQPPVLPPALGAVFGLQKICQRLVVDGASACLQFVFSVFGGQWFFPASELSAEYVDFIRTQISLFTRFHKTTRRLFCLCFPRRGQKMLRILAYFSYVLSVLLAFRRSFSL